MMNMRWSEGDLAIEILHNENFSGNIRFNLPMDLVEPMEDWAGHAQVAIPFEALKWLVSEYVASRRIDAIEDGSADDVLLGRTQ